MSEFPSTRGYARRVPKKAKGKPKPPPPHRFDKDEELGTDWRGHYRCRGCRRFGEDGDEMHPTGAPPLDDSLRGPWPETPPGDRSSEILGEAS